MATRRTSSIRQIKAAARRGAVRGLTLAAEHVLGESRAIVPIEEGTLERSGRVDVDPDGQRAAVSYGGDDDELGLVAIVQHEELDFRHAPGREAKYLEGPLTREAGAAGEIIAAEVRRALR